MTAVDSTTELTPVHDLTAGDVFERHGRTWTVEHVVREWGGSVYVVCTNGGGRLVSGRRDGGRPPRASRLARLVA